MNKKIIIIILTWNGLDYTKKCLTSLYEKTTYDNYEVIVVDNGSSDGTVEYLESIPWITLIKNDKNEGFVRGNNIALEKITDDSDVLLLNNDMIIIHDNWLDEIVKTAYSSSDIGLVGCRLINEKGDFLHSGTIIYSETNWGQQIGGGSKDVGQYPYDNDVQGVVFACALIKNEILKKIGFLNEKFFSYFEDTDYCLRVWGAGYRCVCCGSATLIHYQNVSTNINNVNFNDMFFKSQKTFSKIWDDNLSTRYKDSLSWHSIVNFPTGYGVSSKNIMLSLDKANVKISYKYVYGKNTPYPAEEPKMSDSYGINIIHSRRFNTKVPQVVYGQGDVFEKNTGAYKIGFTMLETTGIPKEWVKQANIMDEVWVPSSFNVNTFINSGVKVPIHIIPLGIDPNFFNPYIKNYKNNGKFTFLSVFEWGERKAPDILLRAFSKAFTNKDDVQLICKITNKDGSISVEKEIENLSLDKNAPEIIILYNYNILDYQMPTLYSSADCFVLPTRGEGWGMPILEAMACGLPVISTAWSSQLDFMTTENSFLIRNNGLVSAEAKCPYYDGFSWANPDEEHLIDLMKYVYQNQEKAKEKGIIASLDALSKWTWDHSAQAILSRLKNINY